MNHLTVDEIIEFVSLTELNSEAINLSASVNGHIRKCEKCLELVRSFQMIYDEFSRMSFDGSFKKYVVNEVFKESAKKGTTIDRNPMLDNFNVY